MLQLALACCVVLPLVQSASIAPVAPAGAMLVGPSGQTLVAPSGAVLSVSPRATVVAPSGATVAVQDNAAAQRRLGRNERPGRLGVQLGEAEHGVGIVSVEPGSPAEKAGLRPGDRIVVIDGQQTPDVDSIVQAVRTKGAGNSLSLIVERDLEVQIEELPTEGGDPRPRLGVLLDGDSSKLRVSDVEDGPAARAGVRKGDRLLSLDGESTPDADTLRKVVAHYRAGVASKLTIARELKARLAEASDQSTLVQPSEPRVYGEFVPVEPKGSRRSPSVLVVPSAPGMDVDIWRAPDSEGEHAELPSTPTEPSPAPRAKVRRRAAMPPPPDSPPPAPPAPMAGGQVDTRELATAMRELRAELSELRRELAELRRDLGARRATR